MSSVAVNLVILTAVAFFGIASGLLLSTVSRAKLEAIVHLAAGALLAITLLDVLPEAKRTLPWTSFLVAIAGGYLVLWLIGRFVFDVCPACAITHSDGNARSNARRNLYLLAMALGVHCVLDGIAVVAGNGSESTANIGLLFGLALHKLPEGLALGLLLVGFGQRRRPALLVATGIESLTLVGGIVGSSWLLWSSQIAMGAAFAFVGGRFLSLVLNAVRGAAGHKGSLPLAKAIAAECLSFAGTGVLLWGASRLVG